MLNSPFEDFEEAANAVLAFLHKELGFSLWMVTRTAGDDWVVLQAYDHGYDVGPGTVFRWSDTFCSRMVEGLGPRVAPVADEIREYATAPIGEQVPIGAYVGVPLERGDGKLFGTLCAIDPAPQPEAVREQLPLVELCARLLSTILKHELASAETARRAEVAAAESPRTHGGAEREVALAEFLAPGVLDPASFEQLLDWEEARCRRYGHPACLATLRLPTASPNVAQRAGALTRERADDSDVVAQTAPDEVTLLAVECDVARVEALVRSVEHALQQSAIPATGAVVTRDPRATLRDAWAGSRAAVRA